MYTSLDRVDIVAQDPETGKQTAVQTDHRTAREISSEPDLSTLFALTRILNARRLAKPGEPAPGVDYVCSEPPPEFFRRIVASAGARLLVDRDPLPYDGAAETPDNLADGTFHRLSAQVVARSGMSLGEELLAALELEAVEEKADRESDEAAYWATVAELAAVGGELLRLRYGGRWAEAHELGSTIPFAFEIKGTSALVNLVGKAEKLLETGPSESVAGLVRAASDLIRSETAPRPLMPTFKPGNWGGRDECLCRPILEPGPATLPLIVYGEDAPQTFGLLKKDGTREKSIDEIHARAMANLKAVEVQIEEIDLPELKVLAIGGGYFAAEKILDEDFMRQMQERLGVKLLAAGVPRKGMLLLTDGLLAPETMAKFVAICEGRFNDGSDGGPALSPTAMIVRDGKVCGFVEAKAPNPEDLPRMAEGLISRVLGKA